MDAYLPAYHVEIGRALHTLQDGFSHTYRNQADQHLVTVVLNYVDVAEERLDERVDGPPHNSSLDRCVDLDPFRAERLELATRASYELIKVSLEPNVDLASKQANFDEVLSRYLSLDPLSACSLDNGWCNAPEEQYSEERGCVCNHGHSRRGPPMGFVALGVFALAIYRRRRARQPPSWPDRVAAVLFAMLALPVRARAAAPEVSMARHPPQRSPRRPVTGGWRPACNPNKSNPPLAFRFGGRRRRRAAERRICRLAGRRFPLELELTVRCRRRV